MHNYVVLYTHHDELVVVRGVLGPQPTQALHRLAVHLGQRAELLVLVHIVAVVHVVGEPVDAQDGLVGVSGPAGFCILSSKLYGTIRNLHIKH